jgi:hypothetical protein
VQEWKLLGQIKKENLQICANLILHRALPENDELIARQALGGVDSQHSSACSTATGAMNQPPTDQKYVGEEKIVVAIDLGTTQSESVLLHAHGNESIPLEVRFRSRTYTKEKIPP